MKATFELELKELEGLVASLQRGELTRTDFRAASVHYGVYTQRQAEKYFVRLRVPYGAISVEQLSALGKALDVLGPGRCHLTTRQGIEIHDLGVDQILPLLRALAEVGLVSHETGGSSIRSVMVCPHAGAGRNEPFDVTGYAALLTELFVRHPDFQKLPRKMKIGFSCCADDCSHSTLQDLGFQARLGDDGKPSFRVLAGGGTGALPRLGEELLAFLPADELAGFTEAFLRVFDRIGNRENRGRARVKFLIQELGIEAFRQEVLREWSVLRGKQYPAAAASVDERPCSNVEEPAAERSMEETDAFRTWLLATTKPQKGGEFRMVRVPVGSSGITARQLVTLSALARQFEVTVRTTPEQGLLLRWARERQLVNIHRALEAAGLVRRAVQIRLVTCPGSSACSNAFTNAPGLAQAIAAGLATAPDWRYLAGKLRLRISGCPNGCALHAVADIGLGGVARKNGNAWMPAYRVRVGGRESQEKPRFGNDLGLVPARSVPECVEDLVAYYVEHRKAQESFGELIERVGAEGVRAVAKKYQAEGLEQNGAIDWGETKQFRPRMAKTAGVC
jgi:sulfite reductase beta subunit-like hemoprotein